MTPTPPVIALSSGTCEVLTAHTWKPQQLGLMKHPHYTGEGKCSPAGCVWVCLALSSSWLHAVEQYLLDALTSRCYSVSTANSKGFFWISSFSTVSLSGKKWRWKRNMQYAIRCRRRIAETARNWGEVTWRKMMCEKNPNSQQFLQAPRKICGVPLSPSSSLPLLSLWPL